MSEALICDKCGRIVTRGMEGDAMHRIWLSAPYVRDPSHDRCMHLCQGCFDEFEREYMANLIEEGGMA